LEPHYSVLAAKQNHRVLRHVRDRSRGSNSYDEVRQSSAQFIERDGDLSGARSHVADECDESDYYTGRRRGNHAVMRLLRVSSEHLGIEKAPLAAAGIGARSGAAPARPARAGR
jgi:hypothetical protein